MTSPDARSNGGAPERMNPMSAIFFTMHKAMMAHYREGREDQAFDLADELLLDPNLPLLIRARCHMVLGTSSDQYFLEHAKEAVRIIEEDCQEEFDDDELWNAAGPRDQLAEARRLLMLAEAEANPQPQQKDTVAPREAEHGREPREVNVGHRAMPAATRKSEGGGQMAKKKKVRRVHSGDADEDAEIEEYDESIERWVPENTAQQPAMEWYDPDDEEMLDVVDKQ